MRYLKWVSVLTIFAMLFAMLPATVAEDVDIPIELEEMIDEGIETELENVALELEGLKGDLLEYEAGKQTETSLAFNAVDDFVIDEEGVLTRYRGIDRNVVIPDGEKEIGDSAFQNDTLMESVSIPNSVTYIGDGAFSGCTALTSVVLPDSVTETDSYVFADCSGLVYIQLSGKAKLPKNTASALTWKSSKPGVASVDQKGVVTALKKGAAVITVKTFNGRTAKVTIKVK